MNWKIIETVGSLIGSIAGYNTASTIIKAFIPATASAFKKGSMLLGATLIGSIVGGKCMEEANKQIKDIKYYFESFERLINVHERNKKAKEQ